jgi:hypothetical protein
LATIAWHDLTHSHSNCQFLFLAMMFAIADSASADRLAAEEHPWQIRQNRQNHAVNNFSCQNIKAPWGPESSPMSKPPRSRREA